MKTTKKSIKNISCEEAVQQIFSFIDDHLQGKSRMELEHHLESCRHCFDRVEFERLLKARLQELRVDAKSETLRKRVQSLIEQL